MLEIHSVRTIVGIVGNVISFGLFCSPIPTFMKIWKARTVGEFKPDPYVATVLNCMMWSFYGMPFVHPDSLLVITINATGLLMELVYVAIFFYFSPWPSRKKITMALVIEVVFMATVILCTMYLLHTTKARSMLIGIMCIVFNIIMYASPLTVMKTVIRTKSVKYMPFFLSIANFMNGCVWAVYALLQFDPYILIPNGLGTISGAIQLILYALYYKTTRWTDEEEEEHKRKMDAELQLANRTTLPA
ncbi:PREDICTED: bidirectional sugar transporter SWEET5 [Tarenaya hassleriana]|uniref:bidirectional sugar transporter SWEET5 n=1 Tax=Tarenaya hassleriana TaxID=28532 RepID=UPI00053CA341|nr:PREDICTED: bidirectional sugar transporter SWEET5 [Tarenaya hassleriana]